MSDAKHVVVIAVSVDEHGADLNRILAGIEAVPHVLAACDVVTLAQLPADVHIASAPERQHVEGCHNLCVDSDRYGEPCDCETYGPAGMEADPRTCSHCGGLVTAGDRTLQRCGNCGLALPIEAWQRVSPQK